jgi:hypothetical protein
MTELGGTRITLYAAVTSLLLQKAKYSSAGLAEARAEMERHLGFLQRHRMPMRDRQRPEQAQEFIRERLVRDPTAGHSSLLREFRAQGRAFEYKRFRELVREVREGLNVTQGQ